MKGTVYCHWCDGTVQFSEVFRGLRLGRCEDCERAVELGKCPECKGDSPANGSWCDGCIEDAEGQGVDLADLEEERREVRRNERV